MFWCVHKNTLQILALCTQSFDPVDKSKKVKMLVLLSKLDEVQKGRED